MGGMIKIFKIPTTAINMNKFTNRNTAILCPQNDLESFAIHEMLNNKGYKVFKGPDFWGCTLDDVKGSLLEFVNSSHSHLIIIEIPGTKLLNEFKQRYPKKHFIEVDHHQYAGEDKSHELSSIEQLALILGIELTQYQKYVAAYDKGYLSGLCANTDATYSDAIKVVEAEIALQQNTKIYQEAKAWFYNQNRHKNTDNVLSCVAPYKYAKVLDKILQKPSKLEYERAQKSGQTLKLKNIFIIFKANDVTQLAISGNSQALLENFRNKYNDSKSVYWEGGQPPNFFAGTLLERTMDEKEVNRCLVENSMIQLNF